MSEQIASLVEYLRLLGKGKYFPGLSAAHILEVGFPFLPGDDPALASSERAVNLLDLIETAIHRLDPKNRLILEAYYKTTGAKWERERKADDNLGAAGRRDETAEVARQASKGALEALARALIADAAPTRHIQGTVLIEPRQVYERAAEAVAAISGRLDATIEIASLYGRSGRKTPPDATYLNQVELACVGHVKEGGHLRRVTSFVTEAEVESEQQQQIALRKDAPGIRYELCVYPFETPPVMSPLVIGGECAFLGIEDSQFAGFSRAAKLTSPAAIAFCREHFNMLWDDHEAIRVTNRVGVIDAAFDALRKRVASSNA